jgi:hypothetical protein
MAHHRANTIPARLSMWQRVREYAVPPSMIETATARSAAGDWAGACAAARVDVDVDLRAVRRRHGTDVVSRLRADLRRLAPDLLRWHMPRIAPDGRLRPGLTLCLTHYPTPGGTPLQLVVRTPPTWADAGQRMSLALWEGSGDAAGHHPHPHPHRRFRLDLHRHLWDRSRSGELARRCGAHGAATAPSATHRAPGSAALPDLARGLAVHDPSWAVGSWAAEAELLLRDVGRPRGAFTVRLGARGRAVLELVAPDDSHAPTLRPLREAPPAQEVAALPVLPEAAARIPPDLELLRAGLVAADRLHPLVATALAGFATAPTAGPAPAPADPHRVECRGEVHRIAPRNGVLTAIAHDPVELRREELLVALGGPALPCLRAIDTVHRDPEALRLGHGDVAGALAVVERLLGPGAVLRDGPLREALESAATRRIDHGLFRAGLVAVHPAADAGRDRRAGAGNPEAGHRPRLDRRAPAPMQAKRNSRGRPRTGMPR